MRQDLCLQGTQSLPFHKRVNMGGKLGKESSPFFLVNQNFSPGAKIRDLSSKHVLISNKAL